MNKVIIYLRKKNPKWKLTFRQLHDILDMFWELAFQAQMRGYQKTWPWYRREMHLHVIKIKGELKIPSKHVNVVPIFPDMYPGIEFIIEPSGERFINYGYDFIPDVSIRRKIIQFMNDNPEIAKQYLP